MAADLFGDVTQAPRRLGSRRWYTVPLSMLTHGLAVAAIVSIPLIATGELPAIRRAIRFADIDITPVVPPPPMRRAAGARAARTPVASRDAAPTEAPSKIEPEVPIGLPEVNVDGAPDGIDGGVPIDLQSGTTPPVPPPDPNKPIRISAGVTPPRRIVYVPPVYPAIAQSNHISGRVVIEAIIGPTGDVQTARAVRPVPFLDQAALTAVRQWRYTPALLNGMPVSVILTVSVDFTLAR
jgi:protein TonB